MCNYTLNNPNQGFKVMDKGTTVPLKNGNKHQYYVGFNTTSGCHENKEYHECFVLNTDGMKFLPNRKCVKKSKVSRGCALAYGIFETDCPFLFTSGGEGKHSKEIKVCDILLEEWTKLGETKVSHSGHRMHCVGKSLYIIGGLKEGGVIDGLVEEYVLVKGNKKDKIKEGREVSVRASLKVKVCHFPSSVCGSVIYIFGGVSNTGPVRSVQYYNTNTGTVGQYPDLPCECHGGSAVTVGKFIFIASTRKNLVRFDTDTGQSTLCADQPISRTDFGLVVNGNKMRIFGGESGDYIGGDTLPDCTFDLCTGQWCVERVGRNVCLSVSCVVEYNRGSLFTPFRYDPCSNLPHTCHNAKL